MSAPLAVPTFSEAKNRLQKARAAGVNPNYWYPVGYSKELARGKMQEVVFWGKSFVLYRGDDNVARALENRCAHRQLKFTAAGGVVEGCNVVCPYHGWKYDTCGKVVEISHDLFGRKHPKFKIGHFAVRERYGLMWLFPGDPALAETTAMPEIPELEGPERWACVPVDFTWKAHYSMIIDNVSDFTHAFLHRKYKPFGASKLTRLDAEGDNVFVEYDTKVAAGAIYGAMVDRRNANTNHMTLCYAYPHQWSDTDGWIKDWCFVLPIDQRTTRAFFLFYYKSLNVPYLPLKIPRAAMLPLLKVANELLMKPLLREDGLAVEAEQEGYEAHFDAPLAEFNPAVNAFQDLAIRKWEDYLATRDALPREFRLPVLPSGPRVSA